MKIKEEGLRSGGKNLNRSKIKDFFGLIRIDQWHKNLLTFLPLLFAAKGQVYGGGAENVFGGMIVFLPFFGFALMSSVTYILNDWLDRKQDSIHPIKKNRPIASGRFSGIKALFVAVVLFVMASSIAIYLGTFFMMIVAVYFVLTNLYSLGLKKYPILDISLIAGNFVLRTLAGMKSMPDFASLPYFVIIFALLVIFLAHKRATDRKFLGAKAAKHKKVLKYYKVWVTRSLIIWGYLVLIGAVYLIWRGGGAFVSLLSFIVLVMLTGFVLSRKPEVAIKPFTILKNEVWDVLFIWTVFSFFLF